MARCIITAILTGLLFGLMDGLINANPYAVKLMEWYEPIAKHSINVPAGMAIDLLYGFIISSIFILIRPSLPGKAGIIKGLYYGLGIWFFRVVMGVISDWMMFTIPIKMLIYLLLTGLIEMVVLGMLNGLMLKPPDHYPATDNRIRGY